MKKILVLFLLLSVGISLLNAQEKVSEVEVNVGLGADLNYGDVTLFYIEGIYRFRAAPWFLAGAGLKLSYFGIQELYPHTIPLFFHFKAVKEMRKVSPYLAMNIGYAVPLDIERGGFYIAPSMGINVNTRTNVKWNFAVSLSHQDMRFPTNPLEPYDMLEMKIGLIF